MKQGNQSTASDSDLSISAGYVNFLKRFNVDLDWFWQIDIEMPMGLLDEAVRSGHAKIYKIPRGSTGYDYAKLTPQGRLFIKHSSDMLDISL